MSTWDEPEIVVNGVALTKAQAGTVRVALTSFLSEVSEPEYREALGPIGKSYQERASEVIEIMLGRRGPLRHGVVTIIVNNESAK